MFLTGILQHLGGRINFPFQGIQCPGCGIDSDILNYWGAGIVHRFQQQTNASNPTGNTL
jgi:hypothetical protein